MMRIAAPNNLPTHGRPSRQVGFEKERGPSPSWRMNKPFGPIVVTALRFLNHGIAIAAKKSVRIAATNLSNA